MRKWITRIVQPNTVDAVFKAKDDIVQIGNEMGYITVPIFRFWEEDENADSLYGRIEGITADIQPGDLLIFQTPTYNGPRFEREFMAHMHGRGVQVILFVHDSDSLRGAASAEEEVAFFNSADGLIVHTERMRDRLIEMGVTRPMSINYAFDYLSDRQYDPKDWNTPFERAVTIAGALDKSDFLIDWDFETPIYAFGNHKIELAPKVNYQGSFQQDELVHHLPYTFGLAWDAVLKNGSDYKSYTRYNNPHKVSMYLSQSMPVIVWSEAGIAPLIEKNGCGFTIDSLEDLDAKMAALTDDEINHMRDRARRMRDVVRSGFFTRRVLAEQERDHMFWDIQF